MGNGCVPSEAVSARVTWNEPDVESRRGVELVGPDGAGHLRIPRRLTTLSTRNRLDIAHLLAERLAVPAKGEGAI